MLSRLRKLLLVAPALAVALTLGGCGDSHTRVSSGIASHVKPATTTTLNAELRMRNGQF